MLLTIHPENPEDRKINQVIDCLQQGGVIIYPTDSVYTFGCNFNNKKATEKIFKIKNIKTKRKDFSLVCADLSQIANYTLPFSTSIFRLMKANLPGPFTFILKASKTVSKQFDYSKNTIGIRIPDNKIVQAIVNKNNFPLSSSSVHDEEDEILQFLIDPEKIQERYGKLVDIVIDGGHGSFDVSTIVDVSNDSIEIIRQGKGFLQ